MGMRGGVGRLAVASLVLAGTLAAASAADLTARERRRLDDEAMGRQPVFGEVVPPPRIVYEKRGTGRTCVDDGDGVTCHYRTFKFY